MILPFLWGVAHSSFQVEGSPCDSDWRRWTRTPGKIHDGTEAELGTDFWNQADRDLDWVQELGANAFRFSLAWERLEPREGFFCDETFDRYQKILEGCRSRGIEPVVTLLHFALPAWLVDEGGLTSKTFASRFARYAREVESRLGSLMTYVLTLNDPMVQVTFGYMNGIWPPGILNDAAAAAVAARNLAMAHALAYTELKKNRPALRVSIAMHWRLFDPKRSWNPVDHVVAKMADKFLNQTFLRALLERRARFVALGSVPADFAFEGGGPLLDFLGINYYGRLMAGVSLKAPYVDIAENPASARRSDLGWEIYPEGLSRIFAKWKKMAPQIPVMITENGVADVGDRERSRFLADHVGAMLGAASSCDVEVLGYMHWSLTDNFEWAEGLEPRFGLIEVQYPGSGRAEDLKFQKRPAFETYREIIRTSGRSRVL